jgi:gamma-glutamyltranspeptidase/glutathione hydrolase
LHSHINKENRMPMPRRAAPWALTAATAAAAALLSACSSPSLHYATPTLEPEGSSGWTDKPGWATEKFAVAAANPLATDAGYQVLKAGGSAVDAAIAVQLVLGLVEPQSSGIGGGAFLLHAAGTKVEAYDGRETAPQRPPKPCSSSPTAHPWPFTTPWWVAAPWARPAPSACWSWRTRSTASCPGPACSRRPSSWRTRVSR